MESRAGIEVRGSGAPGPQRPGTPRGMGTSERDAGVDHDALRLLHERVLGEDTKVGERDDRLGDGAIAGRASLAAILTRLFARFSVGPC